LQTEFQVMENGMRRSRFIVTKTRTPPCKWMVTFCKGLTPTLFADYPSFHFSSAKYWRHEFRSENFCWNSNAESVENTTN